MYCMECGAVVDGNVKFCINCGCGQSEFIKTENNIEKIDPQSIPVGFLPTNFNLTKRAIYAFLTFLTFLALIALTVIAVDFVTKNKRLTSQATPLLITTQAKPATPVIQVESSKHRQININIFSAEEYREKIDSNMGQIEAFGCKIKLNITSSLAENMEGSLQYEAIDQSGKKAQISGAYLHLGDNREFGRNQAIDEFRRFENVNCPGLKVKLRPAEINKSVFELMDAGILSANDIQVGSKVNNIYISFDAESFNSEAKHYAMWVNERGQRKRRAEVAERAQEEKKINMRFTGVFSCSDPYKAGRDSGLAEVLIKEFGKPRGIFVQMISTSVYREFCSPMNINLSREALLTQGRLVLRDDDNEYYLISPQPGITIGVVGR